jgi:ankyrin repeat protein
VTGEQDIDSNTPLHLAAMERRAEVVALLLSEGGDPRHYVTPSRQMLVTLVSYKLSLLNETPRRHFA